MSSLSIAFALVAFITGFSLLSIAVDTSAYTYPPRNRWKWLLGLLIATAVFSFASILSNTQQNCNTYTTSDYKYGEVPVRCVKGKP